MLISSLYYYSDAYILAKRTITFLRAGADEVTVQAGRNNK